MIEFIYSKYCLKEPLNACQNIIWQDNLICDTSSNKIKQKEGNNSNNNLLDPCQIKSSKAECKL